MAAELVRLKVDVIVTHAGLPPAAAERATSTIPIVTAATAEPVGQGVVASLARPGGILTGIGMLSTDLTGKRVQLLREKVWRRRALHQCRVDSRASPPVA